MKIPREKLLEHLLERELNIVHRTVFDALFTPNWRDKWSITKNQYNEFEKYAISVIMKTLKIPKRKAKIQLEWFLENYSLKIK